ncbi:hypothetical protein BaRGS_00040071, partial [Batillaria attramentaria]
MRLGPGNLSVNTFVLSSSIRTCKRNWSMTRNLDVASESESRVHLPEARNPSTLTPLNTCNMKAVVSTFLRAG